MNAIDAARNQTNNHVERVTGGLKGTLSSTWSWDAYFEWGQNTNDQALFNNVVGTYLQFAARRRARSRHWSQIVAVRRCRAAFNASAAGCAPLNLFGSNNASRARTGLRVPQARGVLPHSSSKFCRPTSVASCSMASAQAP